MRLYSAIQKAALAGGIALLLLPALVSGAECSNTYDGNSGQLRLSCIPIQVDGVAAGLVGGTLVYKGQNLFELTTAWTYHIKSAHVTDVRIANGSIPVVMVTSMLSSGCDYSTPLIDTVISGFDIWLNVRVFSSNPAPGEDFWLCSQNSPTVVFPVALNRELSTGTYTVIANGVIRTFDYVAPGYPAQ